MARISNECASSQRHSGLPVPSSHFARHFGWVNFSYHCICLPLFASRQERSINVGTHADAGASRMQCQSPGAANPMRITLYVMEFGQWTTSLADNRLPIDRRGRAATSEYLTVDEKGFPGVWSQNLMLPVQVEAFWLGRPKSSSNTNCTDPDP